MANTSANVVKETCTHGVGWMEIHFYKHRGQGFRYLFLLACARAQGAPMLPCKTPLLVPNLNFGGLFVYT